MVSTWPLLLVNINNFILVEDGQVMISFVFAPVLLGVERHALQKMAQRTAAQFNQLHPETVLVGERVLFHKAFCTQRREILEMELL
jgi:hypothetical protein